MELRERLGGPALRYLRRLWPSDRFLWPAARFLLAQRPERNAVGIFTTADDLRMRLSLKEYPDGSMYFGVYEVATVRLLRSLLQTGDTVIDVGGNIGYVALQCARLVGPRGAVHTFEPVADTADRLAENVVLNGLDSVVHIHRAAVGAEPGEVVMHTFGGDGGTRHVLASMKPLYAEHHELRAPVQVLDETITGAVRLIKVDVEGAEVGVIRGARRIIADCRPHLVIENNPRTLAAFGHTFRDIAAAVQDAAPDVYAITTIDNFVRQTRSLNADPASLPEGNLWLRPLRH